jgi:hypothetical protein
MSKTLRGLWEQQVAYNQRARAKENVNNYEYWMKQYLLGAVAEVDEILQEINWKIHRRGKPLNRYNLGREIADLTKFVWCLWEWSGFSADDMLTFVEEKSNELDAQWEQDWKFSIPDGVPVVITDLDGTIGDWRKAFLMWVMDTHPERLSDNIQDKGSTLAIEVDLNLPYPVYVELKEEFEASGGYKHLPFYVDAVETLQELSKHDVCVMAYTARPAKQHGRIWSDTWAWLEKEGLHTVVRELRIGSEDRISRACALQEAGHKVLMLEDDPGLALRAVNAGIRVMLRSQPYNRGVSHELIEAVDEFNSTDILTYLKGHLYAYSHTN